MDYLVESYPDGSFTVKGDWEGEVMGLNQDGTYKGSHLYKPGDVFVVQPNGLLRKSDELIVFLQKGKQVEHSDNNTG
tara:strand:+ start:4588 stop:4818 length:231 start_codon:yes stop_codon:yes gene_type:complete